ncbi:STAS domain-containing protein [Ostreiculturibacter nitratireducens]|uniref:STAS domain-containing protein n=1 Tax=Ostreiculturibacter nitratireducens TaxID=3075226 RepID=UPI0031B5A4AA
MTAALTLSPRLDTPAARPLAQAILARRGRGLTIDAGPVTHLGGLCLQVLASAARTWREDGHALALSPRSVEFDAALAVFGLSPASLQSETDA